MKRKHIIFFFFAAALILIIFIGSQFRTNRGDILSNDEDKYISVKRLCENVLIVSMGTDAVTAVKSRNGIVIIDAGISNSLTAKYRKIIATELEGNDVRYLINTHSHPDHTGGNQVFADAVIVGQENCISEMKEYWRDPEKIKSRMLNVADQYDKKLSSQEPGSEDWEETLCQRNRFRHAYNDLEGSRIVTPPNVVFKDTMSILLGNVSLELIYFGKAHSGSDIIIHIPEMKLLFTGDLFFPGGRPSFKPGKIKDSRHVKEALRRIKARLKRIDIVIAGHGQIMGIDDLKAFVDYFN